MLENFSYILVDLDGTLIKMDEAKFTREYFKLLAKYMNDLVDSAGIFETVMYCIYEITKNADGITNNYERFLKAFIKKSNFDDDQVRLKNRFNDFYFEQFPKLSHLAAPNKKLVNILRNLKTKGKKLILATNPVFPKIAVIERLKWSTMKPEEFVLITHMENSHYCKPDVRYFSEICKKLAIPPKKCVMIGNDSFYDSSCEKLGMKYLDVEELLS